MNTELTGEVPLFKRKLVEIGKTKELVRNYTYFMVNGIVFILTVIYYSISIYLFQRGKWEATSFTEGLFSIKFNDASLLAEDADPRNEMGMPLALTGNEHRLKYLTNVFHDAPKGGVYDDVECYPAEPNLVCSSTTSINLQTY